MTQPAPAPAKVSFLSALGAKLVQLAKNPVIKPLEVWALRAALAYLAVKLGITVDHSV